MFAFPNMFHFFAHEFARLGGRRFAFALVLARTFDRFFFWHTKDCFAPNRTFGCNEVCTRDRHLGLLQLHDDTWFADSTWTKATVKKNCYSVPCENSLGSCAQF